MCWRVFAVATILACFLMAINADLILLAANVCITAFSILQVTKLFYFLLLLQLILFLNVVLQIQ